MKRFGIFLCVIWIGFIFYNSSQTATISGGITKNIVNSIKEFVKGESDELEKKDIFYNNITSSFKDMVKSIMSNAENNIENWKTASTSDKVTHLIRKIAHGLEFFALSILVMFVLYREKISNMDLIIRTLFIVVICAVLDEYLQSFIPGRASSVSDVLIDFWGGIFGVLVFRFVNKIGFKREKIVKVKR